MSHYAGDGGAGCVVSWMKQDIRTEVSKEHIVEHGKGGGKIILRWILRKQAVRMVSE